MKGTVKQLDTFLRRSPKLGRGVYIAGTAVVLGDVTIGAHSSVWYGAVLRGDINRIVVGHHSNVQDNAVLHLADDFPCLVGNWVTVGHGAVVHACTIGDEVLVGMGAVILDGAVVGKQCIIGAKALVTQGMKIPPGSLVLGAPARIVRKLSPKERAGLKRWAQKYVDNGAYCLKHIALLQERARALGRSRAAVVRDLIDEHLARKKGPSLHDLARDYCGSLSGPRDMSTRKLTGYGCD